MNQRAALLAQAMGAFGARGTPRGALAAQLLQRDPREHTFSGPANPPPPTGRERLEFLGQALGPIPGVGDVAGLAADVSRMHRKPEERTARNTLFAGLGLLPFVPSGMGRKARLAAEMMGGKLRRGGMAPGAPVHPATVYHGSPHQFAPEPDNPLGTFRSDKIGTGEGAQAFGYGHYLAENPETARTYQAKLSEDAKITIGGEVVNPQALPNDSDRTVLAKLKKHQQALIGSGMPASTDDAVSYLERTIDRDLSSAIETFNAHPDLVGYQDAATSLMDQKLALQRFKETGIEIAPGGNIYTADLPDEAIDQMLDWDAPLSEQPWIPKGSKEEIIARVKAEGRKPTLAEMAAVDLQIPGSAATTDTGRTWYKRIAAKFGNPNESMFGYLDEAAASRALREEGIPGIRFFDGFSRNAGQGTRNFVVFPGGEDLLRITGRE